MANPATGGQINWPSPGTSHAHQRAELLAAGGQNLLALDSVIPYSIDGPKVMMFALGFTNY